MNKVASRAESHPYFFLGLFFNHEDGGDIFLRNIYLPSTDYTVLYPRRWDINFAVLIGIIAVLQTFSSSS
jgi:hypothetical protein